MVKPGTSIVKGYAIIDELLLRGALRVALSELSEDLCLATLRWLLRAFGTGDSLHEHLLLEALHTLLDHNKCLQPPSSPELIGALHKIEEKVLQEMRVQEALIETSSIF